MNTETKYNVLLFEWLEQAESALKKGFEKHLETSDKAFLEFAELAESINVQNRFLDAQRELWLKSEQLSPDFANKLRDILRKFPLPQGSADEAPPVDDQHIDLINIDDYEEKLALQTIADQLERQNSQLVYALQQRLTVLNHGHPLESNQILASPHQLCQIYTQILKDIDIEKQPLLVLYTQFEKYVIGELPQLYATLNTALIDAGILPTLKYNYNKNLNPHTATMPPGAEAEDASAANAMDPMAPAASMPAPPAPMGMGAAQNYSASPQSTSDEALHRIRDLLSIGRNMHPAVPQQAQATTVMASPQQVMQTVDHIAVQTENSFPDGVQLDSETQDPSDLVVINRQLLTRIQHELGVQRKKIKTATGSDKLSSNHEDVIDIVGMLFDQMLDDEQLHGRAKALLSHLHTTFIKIGLRDADFLDNAEHPARMYFEQAVDASRKWINEQDLTAGITPLLRNTILHIVKYQKQTNKDFADFRLQIEHEASRLEEKSSRIEKRVLEAEKGKAKLQGAKDTAKTATTTLFAGQEIPRSCQLFINNVWIDYLTLVLLRNNGDQKTSDWQDAMVLAEDILTQSKLAANGQPEQQAIDELSDALVMTVGTLLPQHTKVIDHFIASLTVQAKDTVKVDEQAPAAVAEKAPEPVQSSEQIAHANKVKTLPSGTWFEFKYNTLDSYRGRLSWYNDNSERFFFVDAVGKKIALISAAELLQDIAKGHTVYFIESKSSFWDKSMFKIKKLLEKNSKIPTKK